MNSIDPTYGSLCTPFKISGETGLVTIHPEMVKAKYGISPTGRYHVHCIHPFNGSCVFIVEQDQRGTWICKDHPGFISICFIAWIGESIEVKC